MKRKTQYIVAFFIIIIALGFGLTLGAVTWVIQETPDISNYKGAKETTFIYSSEKKLLTKLFTENRVYVPLERIPQNLENAIIAIEDKSFYVHHGIDLWGIGRAVFINLMQGRLAQGGSTITQQLARNALLSMQKSFYRKIQEAYLALQFERLYTKTEILEMYFNEIFFGHSAYGVEAAAQQYFNKSVWELNLSESALIAGLPRAPNKYSPIKNKDLAEKRRNVVLNRMQELGYITETEAEKAKNQDINLDNSSVNNNFNATYFISYVRKNLKNKLEELFGKEGPQMMFNGGLKVYTTLDMEMQKQAEKSVENAIVEKPDGKYYVNKNFIPTVKKSASHDILQPQISLTTLDPQTGAIKTMIGGRGNDEFNRASQAERQPGSAFKPFVYTTAINQGYSPGSVINDMPVIINYEKNKIYAPRNYQHNYRGFVTFRKALTQSINVAAVKLIQEVGIENTINTAQNMGISTFTAEDSQEYHYSLALGGLNEGVTPLEMASAYGVLANQGIKVEPFAIQKILDNRGNVIYKAQTNKKIVLEKDVAYLMTDMLKSVINEGTGQAAQLDRPVAGKTGTTNDHTNAWFVGYTPQLVTSVWIGEDNSNSMHYDQTDSNGNYLFPEPSGRGFRIISSGEAARLWGNYMKKVVEKRPKNDFEKPENIVTEKIDTISGQLANKYTPNATTEIFRRENLPQKHDSLHGPTETVNICMESKQLATSNCPSVSSSTFIKGSEIQINTGNKFNIHFKGKIPGKSSNSTISGTYIIDHGDLIQKIDPASGLPAVTVNEEVIYNKKPQQKCQIHGTQTDSDDKNILDSIKNYLESDENE